MIPLRKRLERAKDTTGRRLDVIQQDYLLSWILSALYQHNLLQSTLVFKGGTALKKCYFGTYRFSEDLDFSATESLIPSQELFSAIHEAIFNAEKQMREYADIKLMLTRYEENEPHPHNQEAFEIKAQFPWAREPLTKVMIEISREELVLLPPASRQIIHDYGEKMDTLVSVYPLEEIIMEKLRAILQHTKKLHEKDWGRSRARDFYDLFCILHTFQDRLSLDQFPSLLMRKCSHRQVSFSNENSFFDEKMLANVKQTWKQWLDPLVQDLPNYQTVIDELRPKISKLISV